MEKIEPKYIQAVELIKTAILQSQYNAIRLANSQCQLKVDLPGLMGFGVSSLKNMRLFYEAWSIEVCKSPTTVGDLQVSDYEQVSICQLELSSTLSKTITSRWAWPLSILRKTCRRSFVKPFRTLKNSRNFCSRNFFADYAECL